MRSVRSSLVLVAAASFPLLAGCPSSKDDCKPPKNPSTAPLDVGVCTAAGGPFSTTIDHEFFPLTVGTAHVLEGTDSDGTDFRVEILALNTTQTIAGITTRVVQEYETENGQLVEISRNFMAISSNGTLCYFGETVDDYEDGVVVGHSGEWEAGVGGAQAGILMPAAPSVGQWYSQEIAEGVAEDRAEHTAMSNSFTVPSGTYTDTLTVFEWTPLECGTSDKVYARGVGMIFDDGAEHVAE